MCQNDLMSNQTVIVVDYDGSAAAIADQVSMRYFGQSGHSVKRRASHILPKNKTKRKAFVLLRRMFGDDGLVANWTRTWKGPWKVSWAEQPNKVVFTHKRRSQCLYWEKKELENKLAR